MRGSGFSATEMVGVGMGRAGRFHERQRKPTECGPVDSTCCSNAERSALPQRLLPFPAV